MKYLIPFALVGAVFTTEVNAQDVAPALDPGAMVGWTGGEAARYSNERRAGTNRARARMSPKEAQVRRNCARKWTMRNKLGRDNPQVKRLFALCRQAGYY
ncbi:hypothetical protein DMC47_10455 [Nostoc sp. 3335mG]|nr:hypothetical protein DMC47_10455 [Nostoc sp. 3335mG]